ALGSAGRPKYSQHRRGASINRSANGERVPQILRQRVSGQPDAPLIQFHERTDRSRNHVVERLLDHKHVRSAESTVVVARQRASPVDVGSAERRLKVEGYDVAAGGLRLREQQPRPNRTGLVPGTVCPTHGLDRRKASLVTALLAAIRSVIAGLRCRLES